jgi:hypothetical protein
MVVCPICWMFDHGLVPAQIALPDFVLRVSVLYHFLRGKKHQVRIGLTFGGLVYVYTPSYWPMPDQIDQIKRWNLRTYLIHVFLFRESFNSLHTVNYCRSHFFFLGSNNGIAWVGNIESSSTRKQHNIHIQRGDTIGWSSWLRLERTWSWGKRENI